MDLTYNVEQGRGVLTLDAQGVRLRRVHLRWNGTISERLTVLGDAWERSYGDLAWLPMQAERVLPWYCLVQDGAETHGFGVETGASAFAFWQVDTNGISLWLDTRNGGNGVALKARSLVLATVVTMQSLPGANAHQTAQALCRRMAPKVVLPKKRGKYSLGALYGSNDWYYAYGKNSPEGILRDAEVIREVAPSGAARPFTVIDDGYQDPKRFPGMQRLAEDIRRREVNPGIWVRPLRAPSTAASSWLLPGSRFGRHQERAKELAYDPTVPDARRAALDVVREAGAWGYDLIKHDFTTYELLGQWGNEMGPSPTVDGWSFHDETKTNAEIIREFYRDIRTAAGEDRIVIGCNTVGHLSAGLFDAQRTGDDVSGRTWERTRRMGVNTLAFRLPQHGIFFAIDADCIPITKDIPWNLTEQWLRVVAATGSVLLISPEPGTVGPEQKRAIREAFAQCAAQQTHSEPADWQASRTPTDWTSGSDHKRYDWLTEEGASPFPA
ncbi:Alpha-galactosidase-like protein [Granulicella sibirica]|uniref:Alpha-galactosidase-like protein n=1 Tax=Granulicella sibirica TaxID=2479048 RepID=A0A4Q0T4B2_9BACT|nr:Alpha-galactosidase-like protein [Granulicella sibirica]